MVDNRAEARPYHVPYKMRIGSSGYDEAMSGADYPLIFNAISHIPKDAALISYNFLKSIYIVLCCLHVCAMHDLPATRHFGS